MSTLRGSPAAGGSFHRLTSEARERPGASGAPGAGTRRQAPRGSRRGSAMSLEFQSPNVLFGHLAQASLLTLREDLPQDLL